MGNFKKRKDTGKPFPTDKKPKKGAVSKDKTKNQNQHVSDFQKDKVEQIKKEKTIQANSKEHGIPVSVIKKLNELEGDNNETILIDEVEDDFNTVSDTGKYLTLNNGATWNLYNSYDDMEKEAEARVRQDLEDEPELFNQDFIDSHQEISDTDARLFGNDFGDMMVEDRDIDELKDMARQYDIDFEDPEDTLNDEDDDYEEKLEQANEKLQDKLIDEVSYARSNEVEKTIKRDGLRSFIVDDEGLASDDEFQEQYGKWLHLDIESAVEDAIGADGVEHFVSHYDGDSHEVDGKYLVKHND